MESELKQQIKILQAHIVELHELVVDCLDDPILRGKLLILFVEQTRRQTVLQNMLLN